MHVRLRSLASALLVAALLVLVPPVASAQTPTVIAGAAFRVQLDHDGTNVAPTGPAYRLFLCPGTVTTCSAEIATQTAAQRVSGVVSFDVAGQARGTYTLQASAENADGQVRSAVLVFRATLPLPNAPGNLRIVAVTTSADGTLGLRLLELAEAREVLQLPPLEPLARPRK